MKTSTLPLGLALTFTLVISACEKTASTTPTPTPTATIATTPTVTPLPSGTGWLQRFAKITASSYATTSSRGYTEDAFSFSNLVNGAIGDASGGSEYCMWRPSGAVDSSTITFTWNSQVNVTNVYLTDNTTINQQITDGWISYDNTTSGATIPNDSNNFGPLPDAGTTILTVPGPGSPITSLTIHIGSHVGSSAGIEEVAIEGSRVSEVIPSANIIPYGYVSNTPSVWQPWPYVADSGPNRSWKAKDEDPATAWRTASSGPNARIEFTFDRLYAIDQIRLDDVPESAAHFSTARVTFPNLSSATPLTIAPGSTMNLSSTVTTDRVRIDLNTAPDGSNSGLSGVTIRGSYTP
jgi:hypothetical protein